MIHQPLGGVEGQASDIDIHAREILKIRDQLNKILANKTGQTIKRIEQDSDRNFFMSAQSALEYGLIDAILEKRGGEKLKSSSPE
jgi:ATP-dependent Clp protease protease subunit